jgi:putative nucleotidyltransferase with HDIG domain
MAQLLVLGPDRARAENLRALLIQDGHDVAPAASPESFPATESEIRPELILVAGEVTHEVLSRPAGRTTSGFPAPILFVTESRSADVPFLDDRLIDRIASPYLEEELLARVDALVRVRTALSRDDEATERPWTRRLASVLRSRVPRLGKPLDPYLEVAQRVARWADRRDAYAPGHAERVTSFCAMIADGLDLGPGETAALLRAAMLHDIGKVALPVEVLHQKTPLLDEQVRWIRTHPEQGAALVRALDRDDEVAEAIRCHHERPDGFGYYGVVGDAVPRAARALAVAEVYDGMTTTLLHEAMSQDEALDRLRAFRGVGLDRDCVDALVDRLRPPAACAIVTAG